MRMQNVRSPNRLVGFVEAIVFASRGLFVTNRPRNHSVARAAWPKFPNDCAHPLLKMPLQIAKALSTLKNKPRNRETRSWYARKQRIQVPKFFFDIVEWDSEKTQNADQNNTLTSMHSGDSESEISQMGKLQCQQ